MLSGALRSAMRLRFDLMFGLLMSACGASACGAPTAKAPPASAPPPAEPAPRNMLGLDALLEAQAEAPDELPGALPEQQAPGWLGVELEKRDGAPGVVIRSVMRGSPAERAGIEAGDIVLSIDGVAVSRPHELRESVFRARAGARVSLGVLRGEATRLFAVDLEALPSDDAILHKSYVGARAPDFGALDSVQGSVTPTLVGLTGRVVVLEFWASWCNVCPLLAPTLNGWNDRYSAQGVTVLGVTPDPVPLASRTASEVGMSYALASDQSGNMLRAYRAFALPTLFVIDKRGNVRDVLVGYSTPRLREIEALLRKLIAES
jgi:peroxiredoxin